MADFPSTIRTSDWILFKERPRKRQIKTPFEAGYVQSSAGNTQTKMEFTIGWEWLLRTEYDILLAFYKANLGGSFNFTHPITGTVFIVRFFEEEYGLPEADPMGTTHVNLTALKLEEV